MNIDLSIFYAIYSLQGRSASTDSLIVFFAEYLPILMCIAIAWSMCRDLYYGKRENFFGYCLAFLSALVARFGVAELIRYFLHRPRPFLALHVHNLFPESSYSFPSGHTIFLFALATGVFFVDKRYGYLLYALSLVVGIARVAAGVHYPSDILGGIVLGIMTAYFIKMLPIMKRSKN